MSTTRITTTYDAGTIVTHHRRGRLFLPTVGARHDVSEVQWEAGLTKLQGNERPYFGLTGSVYNGPATKSDRFLITTGAIGNDLALIWPELAPINALHLADDDGVPMHCFANGWFWLGMTRSEPFNAAHVAKHFRISEQAAIDLGFMIDVMVVKHGAQFGMDVLNGWIDEQRDRWRSEAEAAKETLLTGALPGSPVPTVAP